jgi:hypothetical protein
VTAIAIQCKGGHTSDLEGRGPLVRLIGVVGFRQEVLSMKVRTVLGEAFGTYFRCWGTLVARAFAVYLGLSLAVVFAARVGGPSWGLVLAPLVAVIGYTWLQALHVLESAAAVSREEGGTRLGPVMIVRLLLASVLFAVLFLIGLVLAVVPGLIIGTWLSMLVPAIVLERRGVFGAMRRSRQLVKGHGRKVFAIYSTATIAVLAVTGVLYAIVAYMFAGSPETGEFVKEAAVEPVTAPLLILVVTSMYFRLTGLEAETAAAPAEAEAVPVAA